MFLTHIPKIKFLCFDCSDSAYKKVDWGRTWEDMCDCVYVLTVYMCDCLWVSLFQTLPMRRVDWVRGGVVCLWSLVSALMSGWTLVTASSR